MCDFSGLFIIIHTDAYTWLVSFKDKHTTDLQLLLLVFDTLHFPPDMSLHCALQQQMCFMMYCSTEQS